jgi:hypothetical protein
MPWRREKSRHTRNLTHTVICITLILRADLKIQLANLLLYENPHMADWSDVSQDRD